MARRTSPLRAALVAGGSLLLGLAGFVVHGACTRLVTAQVRGSAAMTDPFSRTAILALFASEIAIALGAIGAVLGSVELALRLRRPRA